MKTNERVAVVMGGPSKEREISFMTGNAIVQALQEKGYDVVAIDLEPGYLVRQLEACGATVVFNAVHGLYGEDGRMQSVLEMIDMPYTGSGVLSSALSMDKVYSKRMFQAQGVPTPKCLFAVAGDKNNIVQEILKTFSLPVVVKPASQGSSLGVEIVKDKKELEAAVQEAFSYGKEIVIEEFIKGKEIAAGVMETIDGVIAMPLVLIEPLSGAYDFKSKYTKGATVYTVPAPLEDNITEKIQNIALAAYKSLGCNGVARADILLTTEGEALVLEMNSVPGMTSTSLIPKAAAAMGMSFPDFCEKILLTATAKK
jgi:D-alanine-D-alanine ligase